MNKNWLLPYGVWLFSLTGFSAIPPTRDIFINLPVKNFKRVISISLFLAAITYAIFVFSVLGTSGSLATVDALSGIKGHYGREGDGHRFNNRFFGRVYFLHRPGGGYEEYVPIRL